MGDELFSYLFYCKEVLVILRYNIDGETVRNGLSQVVCVLFSQDQRGRKERIKRNRGKEGSREREERKEGKTLRKKQWKDLLGISWDDLRWEKRRIFRVLWGNGEEKRKKKDRKGRKRRGIEKMNEGKREERGSVWPRDGKRRWATKRALSEESELIQDKKGER